MSQTQEPRAEPPAYRCGGHWHITPTRQRKTPWWLCNALPEDEPFRGFVLITSCYKNDPEPFLIHNWLACGYFTLKRDGKVLNCYAVDRRGEEKLFREEDVELVQPVQTYREFKEAADLQEKQEI